VVLKQAERGALTLVEGRAYRVPPRKVKRVVDTVGAGDGFNAGFLAGILRGLGISDSLKLGAQVGARAVAKLGDYAGYPRKSAN
jgi:2-dehydro-3-deoxygluconokinase